MNQVLSATCQLSTAVHFYGSLRGSHGLAEAARLVLASLRAAGVPVVAHVVPQEGRDDVPPPLGAMDDAFSAVPPSGSTCIFCINPEKLMELASSGPPDLFGPDKRKIGIWFWELSVVPQSSVIASRYLDEMWAASPFLGETFGRALPIPVTVYRHPFDPGMADALPPLEIPELKDRFLFLFSFAYDSGMGRKNPRGVCDAFVRAFPEPRENGPALIIKSTKACSLGKEEHLELMEAFASRPDIYFIDGVMTQEAKVALTKRCDCFVSLHRSEGLGLTLMEAMAEGKPCIATEYSGNLSFMNPENSVLIPWTPTREGLNFGVFAGMHDAQWAQPDLDEASKAMKKICEDDEFCRRIGIQARKDIRGLHSLAVVGANLAKLLNGALKSDDLATSQDSHVTEQTAEKGTHSKALASLRLAKDALRKASERPKRRGWFDRPCERVDVLVRALEHLVETTGQTLKVTKEKEAQAVQQIRSLALEFHLQQRRVDQLMKFLDFPGELVRTKSRSEWDRLGLGSVTLA